MAFENEYGIAGGNRDKAIGRIIHEGNVSDQKKSMAKKMSKLDRKYEHKATRKVGKVFDGGMKPYSKEQIVKSLKAETRHGRDAKIYRQHEGFEN